MKKEYIEAELELIRLDAIDVITESLGDPGDDGHTTAGNFPNP